MKSEVLYKQSSTGKIVRWSYSVTDNVITFSRGQLDGKLIVERDIIDKGKNIGKKTETTPIQQALIKARQKFEKKLKEGYTPDLKLAQSTKNTLDGEKPMLAKELEKFQQHVVFPALAQPKLDGFRCTATIKDGVCKLYSKTQRLLGTMGHIARELEALYGDTDIKLDGELYLHEFRGDFAHLSHLIKSDDPSVEYHQYDCIAKGSWKAREKAVKVPPKKSKLKTVITVLVGDNEELHGVYEGWLDKGYEGAMYRDLGAEYMHTRTPKLLKMKEFEDAEFVIVGVNEGQGQNRGVAGSFTVDNTDGQTFNVRLKGVFGDRKRPLTHPEEFIGKQVTVRFQGRYASNIPRIPTGQRIREAE